MIHTLELSCKTLSVTRERISFWPLIANEKKNKAKDRRSRNESSGNCEIILQEISGSPQEAPIKKKSSNLLQNLIAH